MAYAALVSVESTIKWLLNCSTFSDQVVENAHKEVQSLKDFMRSRMNIAHDLERQMADALHKLEDVMESSSSADVEQEIFCFAETVRKIKDLESNTIAENQQLRANNYSEQNMMVGFDDHILKLMDQLTFWPSSLDIIRIVGMPGIGKTTLVKRVYQDPLITRHFEKLAFVTISHRFSVREIMLDILVQIAGSHEVDKWNGGTDDRLADSVYESLLHHKYLIVLDDLWNDETWNEIRRFFPDKNNGSRIIITSTLFDMAARVGIREPFVMRFMSLTESWSLLRKVAFAEGESCPPELERLGKKIAQNSRGLPMEIIWVGGLLSKREKTIHFWKQVAENYYSYIASDDDKMLILKNLYPSYENLPQHLKACFLYLGVFPQNYEIPASKLIKLWVSEGFLPPNFGESLEQIAKNCLKELASRCIVTIHEQPRDEIKTCRVHHLFWQLCFIEAEKIKFFSVINGHADDFPEATGIQPRLCIRKNIVLAIKDVREWMGSVSEARSFLCMAEHHQYPLPVPFEFNLLRVLDVLSIRFYNFPLAILKLLRLRYLALTFNGELPASISVLARLQILIVRPHIRIRSGRSKPSFLPIDIWKMNELRHLYIIGSDVPNPCGEDQLSSLQILSGVRPQSCTVGVLKGIRHLKKLGIRIELTPSDDAAEPICPFDHLFLLHQLESFKCVVVNPNFGDQIIKFPSSQAVFSDSINKISLSGCGLPWVDIEKISRLPRLKVLKLREHAFTGAVWESSEDEFPNLRLLLLESMDLVSWTTNGSFRLLQSLILKHCYQLKEIPSDIGDLACLQLIELFNCSPSASDSVKQIVENQMDLGNECLQVHVTSSMEETQIDELEDARK